MTGTLYGIGAGSGDPDLLTLKAIRVLGEARHVFAAADDAERFRRVVRAVEGCLAEATAVIPLAPWTDDPGTGRMLAGSASIDRILELLSQGHTAVYLTLGDPLMFSDFTDLTRRVRERLPEVMVRVVPGITPFHAAAARANMPLVAGEESLLVLPAGGYFDGRADSIQAVDNLIVLGGEGDGDRLRTEVSKRCPGSRLCLVIGSAMNGGRVAHGTEGLADLDDRESCVVNVKKNGLQ